MQAIRIIVPKLRPMQSYTAVPTRAHQNTSFVYKLRPYPTYKQSTSVGLCISLVFSVLVQPVGLHIII